MSIVLVPASKRARHLVPLNNKKISIIPVSGRNLSHYSRNLPVKHFSTQSFMSVYEKAKHALAHFKGGTQLMYYQTKDACALTTQKYISKQSFTKMEQLQVRHAMTDLAKVVPFGTCIIVPGFEVFIPLLLIYRAVPSTYKMEISPEKRVAYARELHQTLPHYKLPEFDSDIFMKKLTPENKLGLQEMQEFSNAFSQSISSDEHLTDQQLISLCQYFSIPTERFLSSVLRYFGKPTLREPTALRTELKQHMEEIIKYDEAIHADGGFENLPASKISALSKVRGIYSTDLEEIKQRLRIWITLSQQARLPFHMLALCSTILAAHSFVPART